MFLKLKWTIFCTEKGSRSLSPTSGVLIGLGSLLSIVGAVPCSYIFSNMTLMSIGRIFDCEVLEQY